MGIVEPIIVIGAPRSGTTILFAILSSHSDLWSLYTESALIEKYLHPRQFGWKRGNVLEARDATREIVAALRTEFYKKVVNYQAIFPNTYSTVFNHRFWELVQRKVHQLFISPWIKPPEIRIVEKRPKNCMRVSFLNAVFPDAFFIFLARDPRANISSLIEGWREGWKYRTYPLGKEANIEGHSGKFWHFLLPPGWQKYTRNVRLEQVCAFQYKMANQKALADLSRIPRHRKMSLRYQDLVEYSEAVVQRICAQVGLSYRGGLKRMAQVMPAVNTDTRPSKDKWKKNEREVMSVLESVRDISAKMGYDVRVFTG